MRPRTVRKDWRDVLNRLYIVVGVLAILVLAAAYVVPHFITWSDYRPRMEAMAAEALGTDVKITGRIDFSLLPQPKLRLDDVVVGPKDDPVVTIAGIDAEFSLMDFLRDRYVVTRLVLDRPTINARIDGNGQLHLPLHLPATVSTSNVSIADARVAGGTVALLDARSGTTWTATGISGDVQLTDLRGPYTLQGMGAFEGQPYSARISSTALGADGGTKLSVFLRPGDGSFSVTLDGQLATGPAPEFTGDMVYRKAAHGGPDSAQGDMVVQGKIDVTPQKATVSNYTLQPDENRAATRLTGTASMTLGANPSFTAKVSGGVVVLGAPDAAKVAKGVVGPYGLVAALDGLPAPVIPPLPGELNVSIAELDLGTLGLRGVNIEARADKGGWTVSNFKAGLPGETSVSLSGRVETDNGKPAFAGRAEIGTDRLDSLALSWRKPAPDNPLFDMPGSYAAKVTLAGDRLKLTDGTFTLDEVPHKVSATIGFGSDPRLDLTARLGSLSRLDSAALVALLPEVSPSGAFGVSFPSGSLDVRADAAELFDVEGHGLAARAEWSNGQFTVNHLTADDYGGVGLDLGGSAGGTLVSPAISAKGAIALDARAQDAALKVVFDALKVPEPLRARLVAALPARLNIDLARPDGRGGQSLAIAGRAGAAEIHGTANLTGGILHVADAPITVVATAKADDPAALTAQLGLGTTSLTPPGQPMSLSVSADGTLSDSLNARVSVSGGGDRMRFAGNVMVADPTAIRGTGKIDFALSDLGSIAAIAGLDGLYAPGFSGSAKAGFVGADSISLDQIDAKAGEADVSGSLAYTRQADGATVTGQLRVSALDMATLAALTGGPAALIPGDGVWPDGPLSVGNGPRTTQGRISVTAPRIAMGAKTTITNAAFDYVWDDRSVYLRGLKGGLGGGTVSADVSLCCAGTAPDKRASGRFGLENVALDAILPQATAAQVSGRLSGSGQFNGTGDSIAKVIGTLNGEGSVTLSDLSIAHFDPSAFTTVAGLDNIVNLDAAQLRKIVVDALDRGAFTAPKMSGVFSVAGGVLRASNLAAQGTEARLFGGGSIGLSDLSLQGTWNMSPTANLEGNGLIDTTSRVGADLAGSVSAPERQLNLVSMVDAVKMKAYELEVQRLEKLKAEEDARAKAAAEERARLAEQAAAAARKAEEAAAAKAAAEKLQQQQLQQQPPPAGTTLPAPTPAPTPTITPTPDTTPQTTTSPPATTAPPSGSTLTPPASVPAQNGDQPIDLMGNDLMTLPENGYNPSSSSVTDLTGGSSGTTP